MRKCTDCKIKKDDINFYKNKYSPDGLHSLCKQCYNKRRKEYLIKNPWVRIYCSIQRRCNNPSQINFKFYGARGTKNKLTIYQIKELWFRDKAFEMKKPSIDRKNSKGHYEFNNCRFIEVLKNTRGNGFKNKFAF